MAPPRITPVARYASVTGKRQWLASRSNGARLHAGIDLAAAPGTPVLSPEAGRVVLIELDADASPAWAGYGPALVIMEGQSGVFHRLTNLAREGIAVRVGDIVQSSGVRVGRISGLSHTHWEVLVQPRRTAPYATVELSLDPLAWVVGELVQYDPTVNGGPTRPGRDAKTPRAFRVGYRGSLAPAPRPRGGGAVPNPTPRPNEPESSARTAPPSPSTPSATEPTRRAAGPRPQNRNGGFVWIAILAALAVAMNTGSKG